MCRDNKGKRTGINKPAMGNSAINATSKNFKEKEKARQAPPAMPKRSN